jgi:hypothetical protein
VQLPGVVLRPARGGEQIQESLQTRDWGRAGRRAAKLESPDTPRFKPVSEAVTVFEQHINSLEPSTQRKYKNVLRQFGAYCRAAGFEIWPRSR